MKRTAKQIFKEIVDRAFWRFHIFEKGGRMNKELTTVSADMYTPGYFYKTHVSEEEKEILKDLKSDDAQNPDRIFTRKA